MEAGHSFCKCMFRDAIKANKLKSRTFSVFDDKAGGRFIVSVGKPFNRELQINECCHWSAKFEAIKEVMPDAS